MLGIKGAGMNIAQGGGGMWIPNQGWEGGGLAKGQKNKSDPCHFDFDGWLHDFRWFR